MEKQSPSSFSTNFCLPFVGQYAICARGTMRTGILHHSARFVMFCMAAWGAQCTGELERFLDEEKPIRIEILAQTTSTPSYNLAARTFSFSLSFRANRNGSYRMLHGSSCTDGKAPNGIEHSGALRWNSTITHEMTLALDDIAEFGNQIAICATDAANYQKGAQLVSFQSALDYLAAQNESTGYGLPLNSELTAEFAVFQDNWTSGNPNRGGTTASNSVNSPRQFAAFVDPNDGYKIKYFMVDMANHRVLVFHNRPEAWGSAADVVIGQTDFTSFLPDAGGTVGNVGFNLPITVAVSATGRLYIADAGNHRVMGFHAIPKTNGQTADFVIGQPDFASNAANNGMLTQAQGLFRPTTVATLNGRFYIVDNENNRVLVFNSIPSSTVPTASYAIGQPDLYTISSGADYSTGASYLNRPVHIAFGDGRLYLSDNWNHRVLVYNSIPATSGLKPDFVIGQMDSTGASPNCMLMTNSNCLNDPRGLAVQGSRLAVSDAGNHRVLFFSLPVTADWATAQSVLGQSTMTSNMPSTSQTGLYEPTVLTFDNGYIWISDHSNHRLSVRQLP